MSIEARKLASGKTVYDVVVYVESRDAGGRRRKIQRTAKTKQEAIKLEARLKVEAESGAVRDATRTVGDLLEAWMAAGTWSPTTRYGYSTLIARDLLPALATVKLDRLSARHLDALYAEMRSRGLSGRSVRNAHAVIRAALGRAVKWGWVGHNVAHRATLGPVGGNEGKVASLADIERLMAAADDDLAFAIRLAVVTGARRSELAGLEWRDIDFDAGTVKIEKAMVQVGGQTEAKPTTKTRQVRTIPLDTATLAALRARRGIGPVLGLTPQQMSWKLQCLTKAQGLDVGWHSFRHATATFLIANGTDVRTVAGRLGHSDPNVTLRTYAHVLQDKAQAAADALGAALA